MPQNTLQIAWDKALQSLQASLTVMQRNALVGSRPVADVAGTILVNCENKFQRDLVAQQLEDVLCEAFSRELGRDVRLAFTLNTPPAQPADDLNSTMSDRQINSELLGDQALTNSANEALEFDASTPLNTDAGTDLHEDPSPAAAGASDLSVISDGCEVSPERITEARLNPKYTFDTFVTGASNRFANAAANAVAEAPARAYNPLFIYGGSGLGKTHLMHAIGHYAMSLYPRLRVKYVSSEEFTNDFINSIRDDRSEEFQRRYREVDVLLIDDIQFIQGKEQTMEEFFHTFNALHTANKQVVITSDLPPKKLEGFEDRMRSRFEMGLLTDVQPPDLETRIAILRKKAHADGTEAPPEVLEYIASLISTNIRELEGALIRVTAMANLSGQEVDLKMAQSVLKDIITDSEDEQVTASLIMSQTAQYFNTTVEKLCSADRSRMLVDARQMAMYLCRELTDLSLPMIGREFGGRDHTTVMHANRKIHKLMTEKRDVFEKVSELTNLIKQQARTKGS